MFDTHAHLNFNRFKKNVDEVIRQSQEAGVEYMVVPGTDVESSRRAVELAEQYKDAEIGIYAAVGLHPHHAPLPGSFSHRNLIFQDRDEVVGGGVDGAVEVVDDGIYVRILVNAIEEILSNTEPAVPGNVKKKLEKLPGRVIWEIGLDRHIYQETKYENYHVDEAFIQSQRDLFIAQLELARKHNLSVIVHNREAKNDLLEILNSHWADWGGYFEGRMVFHCCEPDQDLLDFALAHHVYIGVDGDITYQTEEAGKKREFIRKVPEDL